MKKIYHLSTCDTCKRIIKELSPLDDFTFIDIKQENIDAESLAYVKSKIGSYASLFSKRAQKYKSLGLNLDTLSEDEIKEWLLKEYTFLKRPFILVDNKVFIGNSPSTILEAKKTIHT